MTIRKYYNGAHVELYTYDIDMNRLSKRLMFKNIKEVIAAAKAAGATIVNDVRITNFSVYPAREGKNVDYWCTLTIDAIIPGMIAEGKGDDVPRKKGNTKTVTTPLGSIVTCLFDTLIEMDSDDAIDLCDYKSIILADAEKEALADDSHPYVSYLHKLVNASKISVIARDVFKKDKVAKSLFSINGKEREITNDTVWHDIYNLTSVRESKIAEALAYCKSANEKNGTADEVAAKASAYDAIRLAYQQNSAAAAIGQ